MNPAYIYHYTKINQKKMKRIVLFILLFSLMLSGGAYAQKQRALVPLKHGVHRIGMHTDSKMQY